MQKRVLAGIRATGRLHLGNYLGAVKGMLELQNNPEFETLYMVADVHTITTPYNKDELVQNRKEVVLDYLSAGLDPEKSVIFVQSMVPPQLELTHYLASVISVARLLHLPTYKDKIKQHPDDASIALLNYPVLMAADILSYKATDVPIGVDQEPHLEVARLIARKMNETYGTDFPEPHSFLTQGKYIPSLLGEGKMSKSIEGSFISLTDDLETIKSKVAKMPTDSGKGNEIPAQINNVLAFVEMFEGTEKRKYYENLYTNEGIKYVELKDELSQAIFKMVQPMQERRKELLEQQGYLNEVILQGSQKARDIAQKTLDEVKEKMGF